MENIRMIITGHSQNIIMPPFYENYCLPGSFSLINFHLSAKPLHEKIIINKFLIKMKILKMTPCRRL